MGFPPASLTKLTASYSLQFLNTSHTSPSDISEKERSRTHEAKFTTRNETKKQS
jgi:hypothetical protein